MTSSSKGAIVIAALVVSCSSLLSADISHPGDRKAAPDFVLNDASGATVKLSALKGKVVLLDFWATWCTGCKEEMPWFMEFQKKYKERGLAAVGVALDEEGWQRVRPYVMEHPINYAIVVGDVALANRFGVTTALPVTLLIDRAGRIAQLHVGKVNKAAFEADIRQLLHEKTKQR
jgi:cytochrome c biogenesis protein CcmG/thiol:disulfide interchange protein DsbE